MLVVVASADTIAAGTQEISAASTDLSRRTEQQAAALEETAAVLNQITARVKRSAEGADHARKVMVEIDDAARSSAAVVESAIDAMGRIAASSQQIGQVIGVIDEIAFQTNLLALNSGVEAAKEIKGPISASADHVEDGVKLVEQTGTALKRIAAQISEINAIVDEIATGARSQAAGIQQVNVAVTPAARTGSRGNCAPSRPMPSASPSRATRI